MATVDIPPIKLSLETISHEYTVFEDNQVLTHEQLNGVIEYLTDQDRLTRVELIGVGIYSGLRASLQSGRVRLTRGVGVTTDGDIARIQADVEYTKYRRYDDKAPRYEKLCPGGTPLKTWELLPDATTDPRAAPLTSFEKTEQVALSTLSAVILIESVDLDNDICSEASCDSRGDRATETLRVLLLDTTAAASIAGALDTPAKAGPHLYKIVIDRPLMAGVATAGDLVARYRAACKSIQATLDTALSWLHKDAGRFLWETDPTRGWRDKLTAVAKSFETSGSGIQYYYDYLRDIVETYTQLREQMFGDTAVSLPGVEAFPKHLVLGCIVPGSGADPRIDFYPSPAVRVAVGRWGYARFLARKLGVLISAWKLPSADGPAADSVRITPSVFGDRSLEDRAIPYYYDPKYTPAVHESWNFALSQRGMDRYNHSYHASGTGGWGAGDAARPLESNLGRFTFFRVEGHLGRKVSEVLDVLEDKIRRYNLPITLATGLLRASAPKSEASASELRTAYDGLRVQIVGQLDQAVVLARRASSRIGESAVRRGDAKTIQPAVAELERKAAEAKAGLALAYDDTLGQAGWRSGVEAALRSAAEIRAGAGTLMTPVEALPLDTLAKGAALPSLDLLRAAIREEEEGSPHPLFVSHLEQQPGLEHFAGASRGATLLLVHDENELVIADFMLPCCNCEVVSERDQNAAGAREAVAAVYAKIDASREQPVSTGSELLTAWLANGLRLAPEADIKFESATEADCSIVLELPVAFGFSQTLVDGTVTMLNGALIWKPSDLAADWLRNTIGNSVGAARMDFFVDGNETELGWKYELPNQNQLAYQNSGGKLADENPVVGGMAVYQRPAQGNEVAMRYTWLNGMQSSSLFQAGLIYDFKGPADFSMLLCEAFLVREDERHRFRRIVCSFVVVQSGIARFTEVIPTGPGRPVDPNTANPMHWPIEIHLNSEGVKVTDLTWSWELSRQVSAVGKRIGAFTTVPTEFQALGDNMVLALDQPHQKRVRARLHLDRRAATCVGLPGMMRPFISNYDTWFWLHLNWVGP